MPPIVKKEVKQEIPEPLRPYVFHGVELDLGRVVSDHVAGNCPFCGREGKFSVNVLTGQWRCFVCAEGGPKGGGNVLTFLRLLWKISDEQTNGQTTTFARERGLLFPETLTLWGVCQSSLSGAWLVPGYDPAGNLSQLYRRVRTAKRWELRPTPTLPHQLHGLPLLDRNKSTVYLHESWGNALAFWEVARHAKFAGNGDVPRKSGDGGLSHTGNEASSILADAGVLSVANCGAVGEPLRRFLALFKDKRVVLMFDSDHPRQEHGRMVDGAGLAATRRAAALLGPVAGQVDWLRWGGDGFDPALPSGFDVRDAVSERQENVADPIGRRIASLERLLGRIEPVPDGWKTASGSKAVSVSSPSEGVTPCRSWGEVTLAWQKAMEWRRGLEDVLAIMLAVAVSLDQTGEQLFFQLIGDAGSGKTRFCDAMLTCKRWCHPLEHLTGFHSGCKDDSGEDFSLLARVNHKVLITPEGDVLMSSPRFVEIMSQQRRIFDGTSGATFKNRKEDMRYTGLRTPWIMAGTPALMDTDQARLGDRFLRVVMDQPSDEEKKAILRRVGYTAWSTVLRKSNCEAEGQIDERMLAAYRITGGYVEFLADHASDLLASVTADEEQVISACAALAEFTADLRARPHADHKRDVHDTKELPSRLIHQFVRLARCLAAVLNKESVDDDVLRLVAKVAIDTSWGRTLDIVRYLHPHGRAGKVTGAVAAHARMSEDRTRTLLAFLNRISVVEVFDLRSGLMVTRRWRLTGRVETLYGEVSRWMT